MLSTILILNCASANITALACLPVGGCINVKGMQYLHQYGQEMEELLAKTSKDKKLFHEFLFDLLSPKEYKDLAVRWQIIKQLKKNIPQREIIKNLKISMATVTRGSRELLNKKGGFDQVWNKYYKKATK